MIPSRRAPASARALARAKTTSTSAGPTAAPAAASFARAGYSAGAGRHAVGVRRFAAAASARKMIERPMTKYSPTPPIYLPDRQWPNRTINQAPRWCAVDLRDGNQSLVNPMTVDQKTRFFDLLLKCGFKEIEVGFPAASETDFDFVRSLARGDTVPDGVAIQILSQAREDLIRRSMDSLRDAKSVVFHMYNATSPLFRQTVFNNTRAQTVELAVKHTELVRDLIDQAVQRGDRTQWQFEYSPETFSQTEPEFAVEICEAVKKTWFKGKDLRTAKPIIFNLPATVEVSTPNVYADQIEYFCRNITDREKCVISLHCHNDRGTGIAATELAMMAGADRVEGCLFGNGERTGNVDLVTLALNLYSQGVPPKLDFSDIKTVIDTVTECNDLPVHPRHPYAGELVFTAFSGSHQDAIKKGFLAHRQRDDGTWRMPYLAVDPHDIGCDYEAVIRVNSQSGKGGVAYLIEENLGFDMPRKMQVNFYNVVQGVADRTGREMTVDDLTKSFRSTYHLGEGYEGKYQLVDYALGDASSATTSPNTASAQGGKHNRKFSGKILEGDKEVTIEGFGNGPMSAMLDAVYRYSSRSYTIASYQEAAMGEGSDVKAVSYVELKDQHGRSTWGVGLDEDVTASSLKAILSAVSSASVTAEQKADQVTSKVTA